MRFPAASLSVRQDRGVEPIKGGCDQRKDALLIERRLLSFGAKDIIEVKYILVSCLNLILPKATNTS